MTGTFAVIGDKLKITFTNQGDLAVVQSIAVNAAEYLWFHGYGDHGTTEAPILFSSLTSQQKLNILDEHVRDVIVNLANVWKSSEAQRIAREAEAAALLDFD